MDLVKWKEWKIQTAERWQDIEPIVSISHVDFIDQQNMQILEQSLKIRGYIEIMEKDMSMRHLQEIETALEDLYSFSKKSYQEEEQFIRYYQLKGGKCHHQEHEYLIQMILKNLDDYERGRFYILHQHKFDLIEALISHIEKFDTTYAIPSYWSTYMMQARDTKAIREALAKLGKEQIGKLYEDLLTIGISGLDRIMDTESEDMALERFDMFKEETKKYFEDEEKKLKLNYQHKFLIYNQNEKAVINRIDTMKEKVRQGQMTKEKAKESFLMWWLEQITKNDRITNDRALHDRTT